MWTEAKQTQKGLRYVFYERYFDPITKKTKRTSVTMNSNSRHAQKEAALQLAQKIREKTKTAVERKTELQATLTLYAVMDEWTAYMAPSVKIRTASNHQQYVKIIKKYVSPSLLLVDFNSIIAETIIRDLYYTKKRTFEYTKKILTTIQRVMRYAKKSRYIDDIEEFNELELKKRPATVKELEKLTNKFLNHDELKDCLQQLNKMNHRLAMAMEFISLTGLRCGEMLALRVQDYDKDNSSINVNGTIVNTAKNGEDIQRGTPKNVYSYRNVHLNERAKYILDWFIVENRRAALWSKGTYKDRGYIFTTKNGFPYNMQFIGRKLRCIKIDGKHITSHIFRHTHISMLAERNVPLKAIMQRVGHNYPNTTLAIYTHVTTKMTEQANSIIDTMIV